MLLADRKKGAAICSPGRPSPAHNNTIIHPKYRPISSINSTSAMSNTDDYRYPEEEGNQKRRGGPGPLDIVILPFFFCFFCCDLCHKLLCRTRQEEDQPVRRAAELAAMDDDDEVAAQDMNDRGGETSMMSGVRLV